MLNPLYYGLGGVAANFWVWARRKRGGSLILFDRYYYEYFIQTEYSRCPRSLIRFFLKLVPKPDLVILFKAPPEAIHERKPELSIEEIERQLAAYGELVRATNGGVEILSADGVEQTTTQVQQAILMTLIEKCSLT